MANPSDVTALLVRWSQGDDAALNELLPVVYAELRRIAQRQLARERGEGTLAPTALVHELYLRLVDQRHPNWQNRAQFFGVAAQLMRRILVDHARARLMDKRGGGATLIRLDAAGDPSATSHGAADVLAIDSALERLAAQNADHARIVELRFFGGLTIEEIACLLGRSARTVTRQWRLARAWLFRELQTGPS